MCVRIALWMLGYGCHFLTKHITIANSAAEALMFAMRACHNSEAPEDYVLGIESPGSLLFGYCARLLGMNYIEIPSDPVTGLCVDDLARYVENGTKFSAIVLSSCNADPTGAVMPEPNKKRLVELCRKHGVPIIEFDEYGHFCAERQQHPPVKVLDHEMVIYVCDFSRIFGSSLPLAFIESGQYTKMLLFLKAISGISVPLSLLQTLSGLLDAEYLAGHIEKCRERIDRTAKVFTELVRGAVPESVSIRRSQGALWIELPGGKKHARFWSLPCRAMCTSRQARFSLDPGRAVLGQLCRRKSPSKLPRAKRSPWSSPIREASVSAARRS